MRLPTLLFEAAAALQLGDALLPDLLFPILDQARVELDDWANQVESCPHPEGLEGFDDSFLEAIDSYFEAIDLLELAVAEQVPELASAIKCCTQDAIDILRDIRERAQTQHQILQEEELMRG